MQLIDAIADENVHHVTRVHINRENGFELLVFICENIETMKSISIKGVTDWLLTTDASPERSLRSAGSAVERRSSLLNVDCV